MPMYINWSIILFIFFTQAFDTNKQANNFKNYQTKMNTDFWINVKKF